MAQSLPKNAIDISRLIGSGGDTAEYIIGTQFFTRPWISVPGGSAFVWPLGIEGFDIAIDPTLGIHKYIGDNAVEVDVIHRGQENITLEGTFPGHSGTKAMQALRDIVYQGTPEGGKLLYLPRVLPQVQRVKVQGARFSHPNGDMMMDIAYSIEFIRVGTSGKALPVPPIRKPVTNPTPGKAQKGKAAHTFIATSSVNTLRKIAQAKFGNASKWAMLYNLNERYFQKHSIRQDKAPDYRLPTGTAIHY